MNKKEKAAIIKSFELAQERIFKKIKETMAVMAKDQKLKKKMENEIKRKLSS